MTNKGIYGPWIKWDGGERPVPPETMVKIKLRSGCFFGSLSEFRVKVLEDEGGNTATVKSMQYLGMANIAAVTFGRRDLVDRGSAMRDPYPAAGVIA